MTATALHSAGVGSRDPGVGVRVPSKATQRMHREVSALLTITHRLGLRLKHVLRATPIDALPDESFVETYKVYSQTLLRCLSEERQRRAAHKGGETEGEPMTEAEVQAELLELARTSLSTDDLRAEIERREREAAAVIEVPT